MDTYTISFSGLSLEADFYPASGIRRNKTILYFHGGGLLCGSRKDLPVRYLNLFLADGYDFLAFDYPLAPESTVPQIIEACQACLSWFLDGWQKLPGLTSPEYILFGRSAGAYLALMTAYALSQADVHEAVRDSVLVDVQANIQKNFRAPLGLLLFYGYHGLKEPEFSRENAYYQTSFATVTRNDAFLAVKNSPDLDTLKSPRLLLYLYARQSGSWTSLLGSPEELASCSLSPEQLVGLPPAFLTASSTDHDVPFRISKTMSRKIPRSRFYPVYNLDHDFDSDTTQPEGRKAYEECLKWMDETI
ncbi:alpha/beta hydrolase [Clostridium sp. AM58-1XD]|uniref:alpha/beta hydrolase n=1 Tax=Clostridium sp. AM58-1XD TaxID=2292307 RepID=UPI000E543ECA|nr:alpha/beta hydrolase [Clostridium sp. AM58-1XD]RGY97167.1 alpha/beta hydrolase [Clostridium sp. AM58-1XD]